MPDIPEDCVRVTLTHGIAGNTDKFVNNINLRVRKSPGTPFDWAERIQHIADRVREKYVLAGSLSGQLIAPVRLEKIETYHLRASQGSLASEKPGTALHKGLNEVQVAGGAAGNILPYSVSAVVTLIAKEPGVVLANPRTGPNPSRQRRGRIFWVPTAVSNMDASTGKFTTGYRDALANAWSTFLNELEGMHVSGTDAMTTVGILSKAGGAFHRLTSIRVDNLPDTQRRRDNDLVGSPIDKLIVREPLPAGA